MQNICSNLAEAGIMKRNRMKPFSFLFLLLTVSFFSNAQTPVLLRVVSNEQHDTLGCNIVKEITAVVYKQILSGKVKLWDAPQKEIQITALTLKEIERSSNTSFTEQEIIYIYEYWTGTARSLKSVTSGFTFSGKTKTGEEVSYGYISFADLQDIIFTAPVNNNANGNLNTTLGYYLNGKNFAYHIIQYGETVIDNFDESNRIKLDVTGGTGKFPNSSASNADIPQKLVSWLLDVNNNSDSQKYLNARRFANGIEDFLKENKEMFFNLGGDKIITHVSEKNKFVVTKVVVKEVWKKINNEIEYDPVSIIIYVNDSALNEILYRDMIRMDVVTGGKSWLEFIRNKEFPFVVQKINSQTISKSEAYLYLKALQSVAWNKLTEYVKNY